MLGADGVVLATNAAWDRLLDEHPGHPGADAATLALLDVLPGSDRRARALGRAVRAVAAGTRPDFRTRYVHRDDRGERCFELSVARVAGRGTERVVVRREPLGRPDGPHDATSLTWLARIEDALAGDGFTLLSQPIVRVADGEVVQHELLLRMRDDDGGALLAPGAFLPVAEHSGLITRIDRWVLREGLRLAAGGQPVALNVSAVSVGDPGLVSFVGRELRRAGTDPRLVTLELTETALVRDEALAASFLGEVRRLGCRVALDDFGAGFGGFVYLRRLPVDVLKIDVELVRDLTRDPACRHVVEAIVALASAFGLQTVAEGVEEPAALTELQRLGVDLAQGFAIGRPGPVAALAG